MRPNPFIAGFLLCSVSLFSACSKSSQQPNTPSVPATVYIAGEGNSFGIRVAKYWKDSAQLVLSDSTRSENISAIYVSGNDVYLSGTESSSPGINPKAAYWKNGVRILMNEQNSAASGITVSGSDVYISGDTVDAYNKVYPMYWKNGVAVSLPSDASPQAYTSAIAVSGNDVYVSGYEKNPLSTDREIARYWKNGIAVNLSDTSKTAEANAMFISGSDVYVAGFESVKGANSIAKYWKNGIPVTLSDGSSAARLTGIWVSGTDVYACGMVNAPGSPYPIATYWKNGNMISLKGPNTTISQTTGITVFQNDVYVSGNEDVYPKYWKNGTMVNIPSSSQSDLAMGIFVVPPKK